MLAKALKYWGTTNMNKPATAMMDTTGLLNMNMLEGLTLIFKQ